MQHPDWFGKWHRFQDAPAGSYACVHAPDNKLETASLSWMPAARGQVPQDAQRGMVLPLPNIENS